MYAARRGERGLEGQELNYTDRLKEFTVLADVGDQATEITLRGWDWRSAEPVTGVADGGVIDDELDGGWSGALIRQNSLDDNAQFQHDHLASSESLATVAARASFGNQARRFVTGEGTADPDWLIRVGSPIVLTDLGELFEGKYYAARVRWTFNRETGPRTSFVVQRPGIGGY